MKLLTIEFDDLVNIDALPEGVAVSVSDGTTTINGKVLLHIKGPNSPPAELVPHSHPADSSVSIGPAEPS